MNVCGMTKKLECICAAGVAFAIAATADGAAVSYAADASTPEKRAALIEKLWAHDTARDVQIWPEGRIPLKANDKPIRFLETELYDSNLVVTDINDPFFTFFPAEGNGVKPVVVVLPGGGYWQLGWNKEGTEVAAWLNSRGFSAAVLLYRAPDQRIAALCDLQRTIGLLRHDAKKYSIDPDRVGVVGFSAGANLAIAASTNWRKRAYPRVDAADDRSCRPDFQMPIYPWDIRTRKDPAKARGWTGFAIRDEYPIDGETPPAYIVQAADDFCELETAVSYNYHLRQANVASQVRIYPDGGHGYGLRRRGKTTDVWSDEAAVWLEQFRRPAKPGTCAEAADRADGWLGTDDAKEFFEFLRFPSVGTDKARLQDCVRCATWLADWFRGIGAEAELLSAESHPPVVYAELKGRSGAPTVLLYGHYDVQPPEPLEGWKTPPFEPDERDGWVYARGADDDKGQLFALLCGVREFIAEKGRDAVNIKIVVEGQEECGSAGLFRMMEDESFRKRVAADVMLVSDTPAGGDLRPAIMMGLRGINIFTVTLTAANRDLHSGEYGSIAPNAAQGMAELMASLHNPDGSIAVDGFCDGIVQPSDEELAAATAGIVSDEAYAKDIGTEPCGGERGKAIARRNCFEPTIELNGIHSGYGGPGAKTVIPCQSIAKISTRLVPGQDPMRSYEAIKRHLEARCPKGMRVEVDAPAGCAPGFRLPLSSPHLKVAADVLKAMDPRGPVYRWSGGSIPVVYGMSSAAGAAPLVVGWGQPEDNIHSPNERFSIRQFRTAKDWAKRILSAF